MYLQNNMKPKYFLCLLLLQFSAQAMSTSIEAANLVEFVRSNSAGSMINIMPATGSKSNHEDAKKIYFDVAKEDLRVTYSTQFEKRNNGIQDFTVLIMSEASKEVFLRTFEIMKETKVRMSAVIIMKKMSNFDFEQFRQAGEDQMENSFYLAHFTEDNSYKWFQVITLKGQKKTVMNSLKFAVVNDHKMVIMDKYDLDGLIVTSYSLTWTPYFLIGKESDLKCPLPKTIA